MTGFEITEEEFAEMEQAERQKHDDMLEELKQENKQLEQKAKKYFVKDCVEYDEDEYICENFEKAIKDAYKKGYKQGQKDLDTSIMGLLKSYGFQFMDCNSIGGIIVFHQCYNELLKENEELKAKLK